MRTKKMTPTEPKLDLDNLSQASAAAFMQVDRTTIRAWTSAGMPYTAPAERGMEGSYRLSVVVHWQMWRLFRDAQKVRDLPPLRALAVARALTIESTPISLNDEQEFRDLFPGMVAGYFPKHEIHEAIGFALAYVDATRSQAR